MEIFQTDVAGGGGAGAGGTGSGGTGGRELKKLMGRRNFVAFVAYDPEVVSGLQSPQLGQSFYGLGGGGGGVGGRSASVYSGSAGFGERERERDRERLNARLSLAVDFVVQGDGMYGAPTSTKYGPVVIPSLEFGR